MLSPETGSERVSDTSTAGPAPKWASMFPVGSAAVEADMPGDPDGGPSDNGPAGPAPGRRRAAVAAWAPVAVFALLLAVVVGFNFRVINNRSESPPWSAVVTAARNACMQPGMTDYEYSHLWWHVQIPCSRV